MLPWFETECVFAKHLGIQNHVFENSTETKASETPKSMKPRFVYLQIKFSL